MVEKNDWKTKDEMGNGVDHDSETIEDTGGTKLMTRINGKASEEGQGPAGAAEAIIIIIIIIIITIIMMCY